jgi:UDP-N-acetylenolpyruvoylglucosamine reductase
VKEQLNELALFASKLDINANKSTMPSCLRTAQTANNNLMNLTSINARTADFSHGAKSAIASPQRIIMPSIQALSEKGQRHGARQIQIASRNIERPIGKSHTDKKSPENTVFRLVGSMFKCPNKTENAWDVNASFFGQTSRTRRMSITATNLERFAGYYATDATLSSDYAKTQLHSSNLSSAI